MASTKTRLLHDTIIIPTGSVATTQAASDNTTKVATTAYVTTALANLSDSAPSTLNTLNELAAALGDDANYATTTTNAIAAKLPLAGGTLTGALIGTSAAFNSGATNVVASFTSTDSIGAIQLADNGGNVEIGAVGNDFYIMNAGGTAKMVVLNSGQVGIGTIAPDTNNLLHIKKAGFTRAAIEATGNNQAGLKIIRSSSDYDTAWELYSPSNSTDLRFYQGGDVLTMGANGSGTFAGDVLAPGIYVGSANTSYDFYNNGTSYFNGSVTIDANLTMSSACSINQTVASSGGDFLNVMHTGNEAWSFGARSGSGSNDYVDVGIQGGTRAMYWHEGGNVSIGTSTPDADMTLQIEHSAYPTIALDRNSSLTDGNHIGYINFQNNGDVYGRIGVWCESASGTDGIMRFATQNGTSMTNKLAINSNGLVGVGTEDFNNMGSSSYKGFRVGGLAIQDSGGGNGSASFIGNNSYVGSGNDFYYDDGGNCSGMQMTSGDINFFTFDGGGGSANAQWSPTSRLHIKENGMIGIHTTAPAALLHIKGSSDNQLILDSQDSSHNTGIFFRENGTNKGELYWRGATNDFRYYNYDRSHEQMVLTAAGKTEFYGKHQGDAVGHFLFTNNGLGDAGSTNCSLVVQNGGTFIQVMGWTTLGARIGTRTGGWDSNSGGNVYHTAQDATYLVGKSNGTAYLANGSTAVTSDERLKKDITDMADGQLAKINQLKVRNFKWKDSRKPGTQTGLIAQEVESVISDAIEETEFASDPDDTSRDFDGDVKIVKYGDVQMRLLKAVQELSAKLDAAEARIATLEG